MTDIPKKVAQTADDGSELPEAVAEMPQETEAPEAIPYLISFAMYDESMCEISELTSNKARKALETFKTIGTKIHSEADFQRHHVDRIPVRHGEDDYKKLYRRLGVDIDLKEIKLQQDARIFYFDIEDKRTFYVVAITQNHLETDKVRH